MKTTIINIVGKSASGKTTITQELLRHNVKNINIVQSYTNREPRHKDEFGHIFIDATLSNDNTHYDTSIGTVYRDEMVAYFNNYNHIYFTLDKQFKRGMISLYVVDPKGAKEVREFYLGNSDVDVKTIYLMLDTDNQKDRLIKRLLQHTDNPTEQEYDKLVGERIRKDKEIFQHIDCDWIIDANQDINAVVSDFCKFVF